MFAPFKIWVPATIAHVGPGYDVFGFSINKYLALDIHFEHYKENAGFHYIGLDEVRFGDIYNYLQDGMDRISEISDRDLVPMENVRMEVSCDIPLTGGLGVSAAGRLAGIIAAAKVLNYKISKPKIAHEVAMLEDGPVNAITAMRGGFNVCFFNKYKKYQSFNCKFEFKPKIVVAVPDIEWKKRTSQLVTKKLRKKDVAFTVARSAALIHSMYSQRYDMLKFAMQDVMLKPQVFKLIPCMKEIMQHTVKMGAYATSVAGSGPSVYSIIEERYAQRIGETIVNIWKKQGINAEYFVSDMTTEGAKVIG